MIRISTAAFAAAIFCALASPAAAVATAGGGECLTNAGEGGPRWVCTGGSRAAAARQRGHSAKKEAAKKRPPAPKAAEAKPKPRGEAQAPTVGAGVVKSKKTGATARVSPGDRDKFQKYVDLLEEEGAAIHYMGGWREGECSSGHKHPCGQALDVCQDARDRVEGAKLCNLPSRSRMIVLAQQAGLWEGGAWCDSDRGHVEVPWKRSFSEQQKKCADPFGTIVAKKMLADAKIVEARAERREARRRVKVARAKVHRARHHQHYRYAENRRMIAAVR